MDCFELYSKGLTTTQVGEVLGIHNSTVLRILKKHGVTLRHQFPRHLTPEQRFWRKVVRGKTLDDCWQWVGCKAGRYGQTSSKGENKRTRIPAHRFSWQIHNGEIPPDLLVCHRCDNPECCNPSHLFLGTCADNIADCHAKGRNADRRGEKHPLAKLTEVQVQQIRERKLGGMSNREIAKLFDVSTAQIQRVVKKKAGSLFDPMSQHSTDRKER
ncbi:MAG: hypothetical protein HC924_14280 [Synechococcaceae cyanobacterium SM2_3_2]|nr:hypothetical protein [Synechococcaceae cyanobacterium SM2_3_2]